MPVFEMSGSLSPLTVEELVAAYASAKTMQAAYAELGLPPVAMYATLLITVPVELKNRRVADLQRRITLAQAWAEALKPNELKRIEALQAAADLQTELALLTT